MNNNICGKGMCDTDYKRGFPSRKMSKILLTMKLTVLLTLLACLHIKASVYSQQISLSLKNAPLEKVIKEIRKQTGYAFFYDAAYLQRATPVSVDLQKVSVEEALIKAFEGQRFTWEVLENTILIKPSTKINKAPTKEIQPTTDVKGRITNDKGQPLPGASIKVKGTIMGTVADADGNFVLKGISAETVLVISYTGFETQELTVRNGSVLNITLIPSAATLEDVVVLGYGTQKKINVTGSVSSVNMADMQTSVPNLSNALAGKVAGIVSVQSSGEPGYDNSVFTIRGIGTFTGNVSPLVIVDGVQRDDVNSTYGGAFNNIDPENIASISLLKDASSTAMYGAKGANGVLIITTKRGNAGKPKISMKVETGMTGFTQTPKMLDGVKYMQLLNEARTNMGLTPNYSEEFIEKTISGLDPYRYPNVNWINEVYKDYSSLTNANLNINGGSEAVRYYISGSFYNQGGPYKVSNMNGFNPNLNFKRYDFKSNIDVDITKNTLLQLNIGAMLVDARYPGISSSQLWYLSFATTPIAFPTRYPDGKWAGPVADGGNNPLNDVQNSGYVDEFRPAVQSVFTIKQKLDTFTEGLSAYARFSFDSYGNFNNRRTGVTDLWQATGRDSNGELIYNQTRLGEQFLGYSQSSTGERVMYLEGNVNYDRTFEDHQIGAMFLYNMRNRLVSTAGDVIGSIPFRNQSLAGRLTYGYKDKYLLEFNAGYTGSENFEKGKKFGLFPSVSGGWVISNEDFFKSLSSTFSLLKIRGSYGVVGNDNIGAGGRFPYLTQIGAGNSTGLGLNGTWYNGQREQQFGVQDLTWEKAYKSGIGLEVGLFNKLNLIVDGFHERRKDILIERASISSVAGYSGAAVFANIGEMNNQGIDASLEYNDQIGQVGLRLYGNVTYNKNKIVFQDEPNRKYAYQRSTGRRFGEFTGYIADGFFVDTDDIDSRPEQKFNPVLPGDIRYINLNPDDDNVIDAYDYTYLGKSWFPTWLYGVGFSTTFKKFDLSLFFQGTADVGLMANGASIGNSGWGALGVGVIPFSGIGQYPNNTLAIVEDRWTEDNPRQDAYYPRLSLASISDNNYLGSTHWLKDGSYVRLKQASLGYTFSSERLKKTAGFSVLYLYLSGQNLLTFSKFKLWDPELGSNGAKYPITRMATIGIRAQF